MYWQHGHSTERDYIYVTTQTLTHDQLEQLSDDVGWNVRSWYCVLLFAETPSAIKISRSRNSQTGSFPLRMGHDDYSLKVENLPKAPKELRTTDKPF